MTNSTLLTEVSNQFNATEKFYNGLRDRRSHNLELYTGFQPKNRVENVDDIRCHIPYTQTLADNVHPLLTSQLPISKVTPRDAEKNYASAKLMDRLIDFTFDINNFEEKFVDAQFETMYAGDAFIKVIWSPDPEKNYPLIVHVNTDEIIPHLNKIYIDDDWPIFQRREMTKAQMRIEKGWNKEVIDSLGVSKLGTKAYRREQMKKLGLGEPGTDDYGKPKDDLYLVVERWGMMNFSKDETPDMRMGCVVIANDSVILNPDPIIKDLKPFESGYTNNIMPYAQLKFKRIPHSFYSISFIDQIADAQVELNDLEAMKRVNYYRRNNPPIMVDRGANVDLSTLKWLAGLPWMTDRMNGIQPIEIVDLSQRIEEDKMELKRDMQNATGANDVLLSTPEMMTKGGTLSATHSALLSEQTKVHFRPQAFNIDKFVERIGKLLINLWQDKRYFNEEIELAISNDDNLNQIHKVNNSMIQGDLDFKLTTASTLAQSNSEKLNTAVQLRELYTQDQSINFDPVDREIWDKAGFDYTQIKKTTTEQLPQVIMKLQQLAAIAKRPDFQNLPPQDQLKVTQSIQHLTMVAKGLQEKQQTQTVPTGQSRMPTEANNG